MKPVLMVIIGFAAGILGGLLGIGGGIIVIPALIYVMHMSQHQAQGTTLAMLVPPIGILAALTYYKQGYVDLTVAGLLCIGFVLGGYVGARFAEAIPGATLQKIFGVFLLLVSIKMIISK